MSAPHFALAQWAEEQAEIIARSKIPEAEKLIAAGVVIACGGDPRRLPVAHMRERYVNKSQLDSIVRSKSEITIFRGEPSFDEDTDDCHPREFKSSFTCAPDVMFLGEDLERSYKKSWWPGKSSYWSILISIVEQRWKRYQIETKEEKVVGRAGDVDIIRDVEVIRRQR